MSRASMIPTNCRTSVPKLTAGPTVFFYRNVTIWLVVFTIILAFDVGDEVGAQIHREALTYDHEFAVHRWPQDRDISLAYRLIGNYNILVARVRSERPERIWDPAFNVIDQIDVEETLINRVAYFADLTNIPIEIHPYDENNSVPDQRICVDLYLSDRIENLDSFPCLSEMDSIFGTRFSARTTFTTWGISTIYHNDDVIHAGACAIFYSAFTYQQEIFRHRGADLTAIEPGIPLFWQGPFYLLENFRLSQRYFDAFGPFARARLNTGREVRPREYSSACQTALQNNYSDRIVTAIDDCIISAFGLPISGASPSVIASTFGVFTFADRLIALPLGSQEWVEYAGRLAQFRYYDTSIFRIVRSLADEYLQDIYAGDEIYQYEIDLIERNIEERAEEHLSSEDIPEPVNLFDRMSAQCFWD